MGDLALLFLPFLSACGRAAKANVPNERGNKVIQIYFVGVVDFSTELDLSGCCLYACR